MILGRDVIQINKVRRAAYQGRSYMKAYCMRRQFAAEKVMARRICPYRYSSPTTDFMIRKGGAGGDICVPTRSVTNREARHFLPYSNLETSDCSHTSGPWPHAVVLFVPGVHQPTRENDRRGMPSVYSNGIRNWRRARFIILPFSPEEREDPANLTARS